MDPRIAECYDKAKEAWLKDHPDLSELAWELISDRERDEYFYEEMQRAGFKKSIVNGMLHFE